MSFWLNEILFPFPLVVGEAVGVIGRWQLSHLHIPVATEENSAGVAGMMK
jgi:hypothetical protein